MCQCTAAEMQHTVLCHGYMWNKIISVFYFTCNHVWHWTKIIWAAEGVPGVFFEIISATMNMLEHVKAAISLWNNFETISGKFPRAEIKLFQTDVDEGWNNFISHVTTGLSSVLLVNWASMKRSCCKLQHACWEAQHGSRGSRTMDSQPN